SEPVRGVVGTAGSNAKLMEVDAATGSETAVPVRISGVAPNGDAVPDVTSAVDTVTSLTIQPLQGLKYGQGYKVSLTSAIQDLDKDAQGNAAPRNLVAFESTFSTFGPEVVGGSSEVTGSPAVAVIGSRAYLARTNAFVNGTLEGYKIIDPVLPTKVAASESF